MTTKVTLIGGPFDGETREVPDNYGTEGVFVPHAGRTHFYLFKGDVYCIDGSTHRYVEFSNTIDVHIPEFTP